jgi:uncharacterized protein (DUF305 family)
MKRFLLVTFAVLAAVTVLACGGDDNGDSDGGHDMSSMGEAASTAAANAPFDAMFIDSMIMHHEGAISMAQQALKEASRPEIKSMANDIIRAQESEITQMRQWRDSWYPNLPDTGGMGMDMGDMEVSTDSNKPFDQRFIEAMIPHHEGAIAMAKEARDKASHAELKTLADNIVTAQEGEIAQLTKWKRDWFGL